MEVVLYDYHSYRRQNQRLLAHHIFSGLLLRSKCKAQELALYVHVICCVMDICVSQTHLVGLFHDLTFYFGIISISNYMI